MRKDKAYIKFDDVEDYIDNDVYSGLDRTDDVWFGEASSYSDVCESADRLERLDEQRIEIITLYADDDVDISYDYFNPIRFKMALSQGILHFAYRKVNGDVREAYGTTSMKILRQNGCRFLLNRNKKYGNNIRYYDMYCKGWRSFKPERLIRIFEQSNHL